MLHVTPHLHSPAHYIKGVRHGLPHSSCRCSGRKPCPHTEIPFGLDACRHLSQRIQHGHTLGCQSATESAAAVHLLLGESVWP